MRRRETYVYKLNVVLPAVPNFDLWKEDHACGPDYREFRWPVDRAFLSKEGAQTRAHWFQRYGATVEIVRSEPVEFLAPTGVRKVTAEDAVEELHVIEKALR